MLPRLRRFLALLLLAPFLALPAGATWSIVAINLRTGEVAVASATCLQRFNLKAGVPVIVVGKGAAAAQSAIDITGENRMFIFDSLKNTDLKPWQILRELKRMDRAHQQRQYGFAAFTGAPVTFTGKMAGQGKGGVTGEVDGYVYSIQGNVLVGIEVVLEAEKAFRDTKGDMGQRLMAAMEAARVTGGDGRCSCDQFDPTGCGVPPNQGKKSAHVGFVVVGRMGDTDGNCNAAKGCAQGKYHLDLNVGGPNGKPSSPDPVFQLQTRYDNWRRNRRGRPDGILSRVVAVQSLPADGLSTRTVTVHLVDLDGAPLTSGGAKVQVAALDGDSIATPGPMTDHGDGTYSFELTAGEEIGTDQFVITAGDGFLKATLYPYLEVRSDPVTPLHAGFDEVSALAGVDMPFALNVPTRPRAFYMILGTMSGTVPGLTWGPFSLPLNPDRLTLTTLIHGGRSDMFPGTIGKLNELGRAQGALIAPPELLTSLIGLRLDWAAVVLGKGWPLGTNAVGFDIVP